MSTHLRWLKGGEADVTRVTGDAVVLRSTIPSPPGSRIDGALTAGGDASVTIRVKIHASKRQDDGSFVLEGRLIDVTREIRERLVALAGG
ncbi:hypothetical protein [Pendulispora albinea]|uniref:Uncharacterized protein n=1 Tax=Pendulispora albinea TaxID=2741071 RepID=A0ABZ2LVN2_9BACT